MKDLKTLLHPLHLELLQEEKPHSQFINTDQYKLIFIRTAIIDNNALELLTRRFVLMDDDVYEYVAAKKEYVYIASHEAFFKQIDHILYTYESIIESYIEIVDEKEDALYQRQLSPLFLNEWFDLKQDLTRLERTLIRLENVLRQIEKAYEKDSAPLNLLIEDADAQKRVASWTLSRLDTLYTYVTSLKNEKMNRSLYILTILSAIFLPLNLIVGFFGMNTQNMFFGGDAQGTLFVVYIILATFFVTVIGFPLLRRIEKAILRRVLGNFGFYQKITKKIDDIEKGL